MGGIRAANVPQEHYEHYKHCENINNPFEPVRKKTRHERMTVHIIRP